MNNKKWTAIKLSVTTACMAVVFLLVLVLFYYRKQLRNFYFKQLKSIQESEQTIFGLLHNAAQSKK